MCVQIFSNCVCLWLCTTTITAGAVLCRAAVVLPMHTHTHTCRWLSAAWQTSIWGAAVLLRRWGGWSWVGHVFFTTLRFCLSFGSGTVVGSALHICSWTCSCALHALTAETVNCPQSLRMLLWWHAEWQKSDGSHSSPHHAHTLAWLLPS